MPRSAYYAKVMQLNSPANYFPFYNIIIPNFILSYFLNFDIAYFNFTKSKLRDIL